jgi:hypothetical protein
MTLEQRFLRHVEPMMDDRGCWEWAASRYPKGYGQFRETGKTKTGYAHRSAYEIFRGPIPKDLHVLHRCDNPPCVNPTHLFLGTNLDNQRDSFIKGRSSASKFVKADNCQNSHEFSAENTALRKDSPGRRICKTCRNSRARALYLERRRTGLSRAQTRRMS